jgi:rod shape determining protein RodA
MSTVFQLPKKKAPEEISFLADKLRFLKDSILKLDFLQMLSAFCLAIIGIIFIYSAGQQVGGTMRTTWDRQVVWVLVGIVLWLFFSYSNYRILGIVAPVLYVASLFLLVLIFFFGVKIYGARRWLDIGVMNIQPSEFAKITTLLLVARIASLRGFKINRLSHLCGLSLIALVPFVLVLKQPDLGSSLVFLAILAAVVFASRLSWKKILLITFAVLILVPSVYPFLKDYQKERILVFISPDRDPLGQGWTSRQALLAVGSGGFAGKGLMNGTQNTLGFLPSSVSNSDLIFSVIAEESGFIGAAVLIALYTILIYSMLRTAFFARDKFGYLLAVGVAAMFFEHSYVNIGMNIRLMPITGLPLPLVSYGGSFVLTTMVCLGILQSIYIHRKKYEE